MYTHNEYRYVEADFSLECTDDFKKTYWPVAAIYTLIYPIGIPLLILYKLVTHKHLLYDPLTNEPYGLAKQKYGSIYDMYVVYSSLIRSQWFPTSYDEGSHISHGTFTQTKIKHRYKPSHWYWEAVDMWRKLLFCAVLQFVYPYVGVCSRIS